MFKVCISLSRCRYSTNIPYLILPSSPSKFKLIFTKLPKGAFSHQKASHVPPHLQVVSVNETQLDFICYFYEFLWNKLGILYAVWNVFIQNCFQKNVYLKVYMMSNILLLEEAPYPLRNVIYNSKAHDRYSQSLNSMKDMSILYHFRKMQWASNCGHNTALQCCIDFKQSRSLTITAEIPSNKSKPKLTC